MKISMIQLYALLGAAASLLMGKKRRGASKLTRAAKGAALGAAVAWGAPKAGVELPRLGGGA